MYIFLTTVLVLITFTFSYNKYVDIKFIAHDAFLESLSSGMVKVEWLESQIILINVLRAGIPKGINRIAKIS